MDRDIREKAGPLEKQIAGDLGVTVEEVLISERLGTDPAGILAQKAPTVGARKRKLLEGDEAWGVRSREIANEVDAMSLAELRREAGEMGAE